MTAIAYENVALTDGYQIWEGDSTLESDLPASDLLLLTEDVRVSLRRTVFYPLACAVTLGVRLLVTGDLPSRWGAQGAPEYGSAAEHAHYEAKVAPQREVLASRAFTALDEDTQRKTVYWSRRKVAYTASLAVPTSLHASEDLAAAGLCEMPKASAPCTCETDPAARALYLQGEYGVQQYNDHEWDVLSAAFAEYNALPKWERERYTSLATPQARALAAHFEQQEDRDNAEKHCRATRHYFGLELEQQLSGSPEVANPDTLAYQEIVEGWDDYVFGSHRTPVVAGIDGWDEDRGYLTHESNRLNDTSVAWFRQQIAAEYTRRAKYGDVWHSPTRPVIEKRRKDGSTYTVRGRSRFYVQQQNKAAYRARRQREIAEVLITLIGREITDPAVTRRIEQLGYDAAIAAMQEKVKGLDIAAAFPEARLALV